eukprot:TRINITY_DN13981_c0_g1_i1.p1 TRINITY_DN13981_c0_g1~~TRINITY_DN13981_c0_g1_i1.p1  ORF type:complete len:300 (+),score=23.90 TRINITY_DN13981_c0_g1_i1:69-968(+)
MGCCAHRVWGWHELQPRDFVVSYLLPDVGLLIWRIIAFCYFFITVVYMGVVSWNGRDLRFFTNLTYICQLAYFVFALVLSVIHQILPSVLASTRSHWFFYGLQIFYECLTPNAIIVTIVYWTLLAPANPSGTTFLVHAVNSPMMLLETMFNHIDHVPLHVIFQVSTALIYMFYSWIWYGAANLWIYTFLDWSSRWAAAFYIGLLIAFVIFYFLVFGLTKLRNRVCALRNPKQLSANDVIPPKSQRFDLEAVGGGVGTDSHGISPTNLSDVGMAPVQRQRAESVELSEMDSAGTRLHVTQ